MKRNEVERIVIQDNVSSYDLFLKAGGKWFTLEFDSVPYNRLLVVEVKHQNVIRELEGEASEPHSEL